MKKLNFKMAGLAILAIIAMAACEKDDAEKTNSFSYDSKTYNTVTGQIEFYGAEADNKSAHYGIILVSSGLTFDATSEEWEGTGDYFFIELNSSSLTELKAETYSFDYFDFGIDVFAIPGTFTNAGIGIAVNQAEEFSGNEYYTEVSSSGTVTVSKSGNTYEITYSIKLDNGKLVTGYYKGSLTLMDYSE